MNKQELIKIYENTSCTLISINGVLEDLRQLDEPQKVVVPQFVANFITEQKKLGHTLSYSIDACMSDRVAEWYWDNSELFARAWLDGYEVEKEKRYLVKMKNLRALFCYLAYIPDEGYWTLMASGGKSIVIKHTRKQLEEAGFGWVFDCTGIEIEEAAE